MPQSGTNRPEQNNAMIKSSHAKPLFIVLFVLAAILAWALSVNQPHEVAMSTPPSPAKVSPPQIEDTKPSHECPDTPSVRVRQKLAAVLQQVYKKEGRILTVTATGTNCEILELSGMLEEGNYTFAAAQRETVNCDDCMFFYKKAEFKAVHFVGPSMDLEYSIR